MLHLIALSVFAPSVAASDSEAHERIAERCNELLWTKYEECELPGGCAALILPDGTALELPLGYAEVETEREMTPDDRMLSGSIGKTYVTAAAHRLMLEGKLDFKQRASEFFREPGDEWFARVPNSGSVTVGQLLRHQSGIGRYISNPSFFSAAYSEPDRVWKPAELLAYVFDDEPLFAAGEGWAYSDTNYIVIGMILEKAAGTSFYDYVREHFLEPLGLEDTVATDRRRIPGLAQGYIVALKSSGAPDRALEDGVFFFNPQFEWCGGGFASTATDLARWAHLLYSGRAMEGNYLETMLETVPARLGPGKEYGYGVMVRETGLGPQIGHDGVMTGYTATMSYFPRVEIAAALMLNTDDDRVFGPPLDSITLELASIAAEELER